MTSEYSILLDIVGYRLFGGTKPSTEGFDIPEILSEAKKQTVFSLIFPFVRDELKKTSPKAFAEYNEIFYSNIMKNTSNHMQHGELHRLMTEGNVPYCVLKGYASACYYPDPNLREMGDVDFLVGEKDFERAASLVKSIGFAAEQEDDGKQIHIGFRRDSLSVWEQHRSLNGIPEGELGDKIRLEIAKTIETSRLFSAEDFSCRIPDDFHHGLIMLLHVASHLTSEGIGLRHLCDWAVFVNKIGSDAFPKIFEQELKQFGLWKLAQILTLACEKRLRLPKNAWAKNAEISDRRLDELMLDILNGGNFGKKDMNRYREIKYISNRGEHTVDDKSIATQAVSTLNKKIYSKHKIIKKYKILLPVGWAAEIGKYASLLLTGRRKSENTSSMLKEAATRKSIYQSMELFKTK